MSEQNGSRTLFSPRGILRKNSLALKMVMEAIDHWEAKVDYTVEPEDERSEYKVLEAICWGLKQEYDAALSFILEWSEDVIIGLQDEKFPMEFADQRFLELVPDNKNPELLRYEEFAQYVLRFHPMPSDKYPYNARFKKVEYTKYIGNSDVRGRIWLDPSAEGIDE